MNILKMETEERQGYEFVIKWECPSCGNIIHTIHQFMDFNSLKILKLKEANKCSCGRVGRFKFLDLEFKKFTYVPKYSKEN